MVAQPDFETIPHEYLSRSFAEIVDQSEAHISMYYHLLVFMNITTVS